MLRAAVILFLAFSTLPVRAADTPKDQQPQKPTQLFIASGTLISGNGAPIQVRSLKAAIQEQSSPDGKQQQGDPKAVTISSGSAFLSNSTLSRLLNSKLNQRGLEDIKVSNDKGRVKITGTSKKSVSVPFTIEGPLSLTPKGQIRLETKKVQVAKIPGLAGLLGINPEKMIDGGPVKGLQTEKDAITFDPDLLWGLPVHGKVTRLAYQNNGLLLVFGESKTPNKAAGKRPPHRSTQPGAE